MAGLDVYAAIFDTLEATLGERFACPEGLRELVASGRLGHKSGAGYLELTEQQRDAMTAARDRAYVTMAAALTQWHEADELAGQGA